MQSGDGESMMSNVTTMYSMMSSLMKNQPMWPFVPYLLACMAKIQ
jgi:hypothetical protein